VTPSASASVSASAVATAAVAEGKLRTAPSWCFLSSETQLNALCASLFPGGTREQALLSALSSSRSDMTLVPDDSSEEVKEGSEKQGGEEVTSGARRSRRVVSKLCPRLKAK
jgi:hypothetical protein